MVSLNAYGVTQDAVVGIDPAEDGFTYDVTAWLHGGCNIPTVVLIGAPGDVPFRMCMDRDGQTDWTLDEVDFLPLDTPWRLWTLPIERETPRAGAGTGRRPDPHERKVDQRTDPGQIPAHGLDRRFPDIRHSCDPGQPSA